MIRKEEDYYVISLDISDYIYKEILKKSLDVEEYILQAVIDEIVEGE